MHRLSGKAWEQAVEQSVAYFERAVTLDADHAAAHAGLAEARLWSTPFKAVDTQIEKARAADIPDPACHRPANAPNLCPAELNPRPCTGYI
ncbi:MAG: hypothetical protein ACT443_13715 [Gemmatimonadota bacterium]